jgi:hypothetical protein
MTRGDLLNAITDHMHIFFLWNLSTATRMRPPQDPMRNLLVLVLLGILVMPFAYNRPIDLLKMWLGALTMGQLFSIYAIMQMQPDNTQEPEPAIFAEQTPGQVDQTGCKSGSVNVINESSISNDAVL